MLLILIIKVNVQYLYIKVSEKFLLCLSFFASRLLAIQVRFTVSSSICLSKKNLGKQYMHL